MKLHSTILGEGKPFLILHGFLGMSDNWKTLGKKYAEEGFEVHLIDQRNHGRSPHNEDFSYQIMAADIKEYCEQHNLENIILLGHSMGGKTAMVTVTSFPQLVQKLIVVDIAPKYYAPHHQQILEGLQAIENAELESRGDAEDLLANYIPDEGTKLFLLKNLYWKNKKLELRLNLDVLTRKLDAVGEALDPDSVFERPVLFIKGEESNYIKEEDKPGIEKHFSNAEIVEIPGAGHWVHAENMDAFYEQTMSFL